MKKSILIIALSAITFIGFAQEKTAPRSEFTIDLSASTLEAKPGQTKEVEINLNRSKSYLKSNAVLGLSSGLPAGVTVSFEPAEGVINSSVAKVSIAENVKPGNYMIIFKSTIQHKSKGATLKLVVGESAVETVSMN
ncbi:MAG TPA: hypothetical protein VGK59_18315 [Ohtaekwangia sp.]